MDVGIKSLLLLKKLIYVNFLWSISYFFTKAISFQNFQVYKYFSSDVCSVVYILRN